LFLNIQFFGLKTILPPYMSSIRMLLCNSLLMFFAFTYVKHYTTTFISSLPRRIRLILLYPGSFFIPILCGTGAGPC
jgi:hypothetical protein